MNLTTLLIHEFWRQCHSTFKGARIKINNSISRCIPDCVNAILLQSLKEFVSVDIYVFIPFAIRTAACGRGVKEITEDWVTETH